MSFHITSIRMTIIKKSRNNKCWWRCGEKGTIPHSWWECKLVQPLWRTVWRFLKKLKRDLPPDQASSLLGIYLGKIIVWKDTCTPMLIATLLTIARTWEQPTCPLTDERVNWMWCIKSGTLFSHEKEEWNNGICSNLDGPRNYMKWSTSDRERQISHDIP